MSWFWRVVCFLHFGHFGSPPEPFTAPVVRGHDQVPNIVCMWCAHKAKTECEAPQLAQSGCRCFFLIGSLLLKARGTIWSTVFSHSSLMMEGFDLCGIYWPARLSFRNKCLPLQILECANNTYNLYSCLQLISAINFSKIWSAASHRFLGL